MKNSTFGMLYCILAAFAVLVWGVIAVSRDNGATMNDLVTICAVQPIIVVSAIVAFSHDNNK